MFFIEIVCKQVVFADTYKMAEPSGVSHVDERGSSNVQTSGKTGTEKVSSKSGERGSHGKGKQPVKKSSSVKSPWKGK